MEARLDAINARLDEINDEVSQAWEQARTLPVDAGFDLVFSPRLTRLEAERRVLTDEVFKLEGIDGLLA